MTTIRIIRTALMITLVTACQNNQEPTGTVSVLAGETLADDIQSDPQITAGEPSSPPPMLLEETGGQTNPESTVIDDTPGPESERDPDMPILDPEYVMDHVALLPQDDGFDLDDDGQPNNALALLFSDPLVGSALGGDPNEYITKSVRRGDLLLLLDFSSLNDFQTDRQHGIDIFLGRDSDDRRRNNFEGDESFLISCSSLTEDDKPESRFENVSLTDGVLNGDGGQFRFLVSFSNTEVLLQNAKLTGRISPDGQTILDGRIGGAVVYNELKEVVENDPEIGPQFAEIMLNFIRNHLDIDMDGDGTDDAMSASFEFTAVRAVILRDTPCQP